MSTQHRLKRASLPILFLALSIFSVALVTPIRPASAATPTGTYFDHIVIIAMENTPYASVFGSGTVASCPTSSDPFLCSMLPVSSTIPSMNNYGATAADANDFNGCSAACYVGLMLGYTYGVSDGYSFSSISSDPQLINSLSSAGLTYGLYCSEGCPRGNDHFPFPSGSNSFTGSSVTYHDLINAANSASPPNLLWFTPTDSENMHDVSVPVGDSYLQSFLVGTGSIASPAAGSLLASNLFTSSSYRTLLYLWWDECGGNNGSCNSNNAAPNLFYGSMVKKGYVSPDATGMDEYAQEWTIENNWGLTPLAQGDTAAKNAGYQFNDIFGSSTPLPLSASFTFLPTAPIASSLVSFVATAVGGTSPYSYSWSFGDGSTSTGSATTHTYSSSANYNVTLTVTDATSKTAKSSQIVVVSPIPSLTASFTYSPSQPTSGQSVSFTGTGSGGVSPYSYKWNFGDGGTSTSQAPSHTFTAAGTYTVKLNVTDSLNSVATTSHSITVVPPGALTATFTISPTNPVAGQTVTFTASASGGTGPYSYAWNLGGTSKTGNPVSQSFTNGTYTISLTVSDNGGQTVTTSQSLNVSPASSGGSVPTLIGWGGVRMDESVAGSSGTMSAVFSGEYASSMELLIIQLRSMGYNTVRVDFDPYCTDTVDYNYMSVYSQTNAQRAVQIAQHYGFWIIIDYHGYSDVFMNTSCWLSYWKPIVQNIGPLYSQIVWEPENEPTTACTNSPSSCPSAPCSSDATCVTYLSSAYQEWINQTRSLGDSHWIVVQNLCSYACGLSDMSQGYPNVTDPLGTLSQGGHVFISLHSYMDYNQYSSSWTNATADSVAQQYYQAVLTGVSNTGWPALNTEGGTDPLSCDPNICTPDVVLNGSAGYTLVTFHFIQSLVNLYDANNPQRVNWVWWPAGSWTNTPGAGIYGAVQCNNPPTGWGCLLTFRTLGPPPADFTINASSPSGVNVSQSASSTITTTALNGFTGSITLTDTLPTGLSCGNINPSSVSGSGTATVSCSATSPGSYTLTIKGTSGSLVHTTNAIFNFRDFSVSASSPAAVPPGTSSSSTITVSSENGFSGTVTISSTAPSGLSCVPVTPSTVSGSGTVTLSCSSKTQNIYGVTLTATSGQLVHTTTVSFTYGIPPDFAMLATQPSTMNVGSSGKSTITVTFINGLVGTVGLTDIVPLGLNCGVISPTSFTANGTASISCSSSTAATYTLTITGTSGSLTHTTSITYSFSDFSLSSSPSSLFLNTGSRTTSSISLNLLNGFASAVSLTLTTPSGMTASLDTSSISGTGTATLTVNPTLTGSFTIVITGTSGLLTRTTSIGVSVGTQASPVLIAPATETIIQTQTLIFTVEATDSSIPTPTLNLSASGLPTGATFAGAQGPSPVTSTFAWTPTMNDAPGTYTISFTAYDGVTTSQNYVVVTVVSANVLPTVTVPGPQNATVGGNIHFTVSGNDPSGTGGTVILSATGLASGMSFDPTTGAFTFTPTKSQAGQTYIINFTATDSNNPAYTKTESVPIHVGGGTAQPSNGGLCLTCLFPTTMTTTAWLVAIGALLGVVSSIAFLHLRASAELSAAKKRVKTLNTQNQNGRIPMTQARGRRPVTEDDE